MYVFQKLLTKLDVRFPETPLLTKLDVRFPETPLLTKLDVRFYYKYISFIFITSKSFLIKTDNQILNVEALKKMVDIIKSNIYVFFALFQPWYFVASE